MATGPLVSVREYLSTSYRPDCEYVDGVVLKRNLGEYDHGRLQRELIVYFHARRKKWGLCVVPEQRIQVSATRFRVPDVCLTLGEPREQILHTPPFICIEILSPEDRLAAMRQRMEDFLAFGVPYVYVLDPATQQAWRCTLGGGMQEVAELRTENPATVVPVRDLFE